MMMQTNTSKFSTAISHALDQKKLSIRDLMEATETTYEHTRRLVKGLAHPSPRLVKDIAKFLDLDAKQLQDFATEDRIVSKYGKSSLRVAGRNPEMQAIDVAWPYLSDSSKATLISMAQTMSKHDKASTKTGRAV